MKKMIAVLLSMVLLFACIPAQATTPSGTVVWKAEQNYTLVLYASAMVKRTPGTYIVSFKQDSSGVVGTHSTGMISGDYIGTGYAILTEYDRVKDITYKTKVNLTVARKANEINWVQDTSANSTYVQTYIGLSNLFPVGMQVSMKENCYINGIAVPVVYTSSSPEVATVDGNGLITMKSAGSTVITYSCKNNPEISKTVFIAVYSENSGGNMTASFLASDPSAVANVYESPNEASQVLFTLKRDQYVRLLSKNSTWCKIDSDGRTGYVKTSQLTFSRDTAYSSPALSEGDAAAPVPPEGAFKVFGAGDTVYSEDSAIYTTPAGNGSPIANIPSGQQVTLLEINGLYAKVTYNNVTGYAYIGSFYKEKPTEETDDRVFSLPCTLYVQVSLYETEGMQQTLALRYSPSYDSAIIETYNTDTAVYVTEITADKKWAKGQIAGRVGYMPLRDLSAIKPEHPITDGSIGVMYRRVVATGNDGKLYLRSAPASTSAAFGSFANGTIVDVNFLSSSIWARVTVNGLSGYMMTQYLAEIPDDSNDLPDDPFIETMVVSTGNTGKLNVRNTPTSGNNVVSQLKNGTQVEVINKGNPWSYVQVNGLKGYVMTQYLAAVPATPTPATPVPTITPAPTVPGATATPAPTAAAVTKYVQTGNTGRLYLRSTPTTGNNIVARFDNGTAVSVLDEAAGWSHVTVGSMSGYMMSKFLTSAAPATPEPGMNKTMYVQTGNTGRLNLRSSASTGNNIMGKLDNGTAVTVHSTKNGWANVTANGATGYVQSQFLTSAAPAPIVTPAPTATPAPGAPATTPAPAQTMYVQTGNTGRLNLRSSAAEGYNIIGKLDNGTAVTVYNIKNGWANIAANGATGYVQSKFLTSVAPVPSVTPAPGAPTPLPSTFAPGSTAVVSQPNGQYVNLRKGDSADYDALAQMPSGAEVIIISYGPYWSRVCYNGIEGYMVSKYLK